MRERENKSDQNIEFKLDVNNALDTKRFVAILKPILGEEASEQLLFVLRKLNGDEKGFVNHCNDAAKALGRETCEHYGGEESLMELLPDGTNYFEARALGGLQNVHYAGSFHSIGLLEVKARKKTTAIAIDITFGTVDRTSDKPILLLCIPKSAHDSLDDIANKYGGKWRLEFRLDPKTKAFVYQE